MEMHPSTEGVNQLEVAQLKSHLAHYNNPAVKDELKERPPGIARVRQWK